jgi:hypothetical protein
MRLGATNITWDSKPDYDGWGWDSFWSCKEWMLWHEALKQYYGQKEANRIWLIAADKVDGFEHFNVCRYNSTFADFLSKNDLKEASSIFSRTATDAADVVDGASSILSIVGKNIKLIALGIGVYYGAKALGEVKKLKTNNG